MLRLRAHAKVNLALRVGPVGEEGYHPVATVLQTVSLADLLWARRADGGASAGATRVPLSLRVDGAALPTDNTVTQAVGLLADELAARGIETPPLRMRLRKRVPLGAGLGGGSSDAMAALAACLRLWEPGADPLRRAGLLQQIAEQIGSDVPFFLYGGTALATGRGTRIEPLEELPCTWLVLAAPLAGAAGPSSSGRRPLHASTAAVYEAFDRQSASGEKGEARGHARRGASASAGTGPRRPAYHPRLNGHWMGNDLAPAALSLHPEIEEVRRRLQELGAQPAQMSGSGAASFGVFAGRRTASRAAARMRAGGIWAAVAVSVPGARHRSALFGLAEAPATRPA